MLAPPVALEEIHTEKIVSFDTDVTNVRNGNRLERIPGTDSQCFTFRGEVDFRSVAEPATVWSLTVVLSIVLPDRITVSLKSVVRLMPSLSVLACLL